MNIDLNNFNFDLRGFILIQNKWKELSKGKNNYWFTKNEKDKIEFNYEINNNVLSYEIDIDHNYNTQIKFELHLNDEKDLFHLIPCNIHGNNNIEKAQTGEYPILTDKITDDISCSDEWQFRADRSSHSVSILCCQKGAIGVMIEPYTKTPNGTIRNGLICKLPNIIGISVGYTNTPVSFSNKRTFKKSTSNYISKGKVKGKIYAYLGKGRQIAHKIIRTIYENKREKPTYKNEYAKAIKAILDAFVDVNWSKEYKEYSNCACQVPNNSKLKPWRPLVEIGWTGGGVLGYPFALAEYILNLPNNYFQGKKDSRKIFDDIIKAYNEKSGFINDVIKPWNKDLWPDSHVNGWWSYFGLVKDKHGAYTNGSALFYLLKTYRFLKYYMDEEHKDWLCVGLKVLDNLIELQRDDGCYGFSYNIHQRKVEDWEGFAGCWFTGAMAYAYMETKGKKYLKSATKAMDFYVNFVENLCCWGTPMDTWKSIDEEGNLAFIRAARLLHNITGEDKYLETLKTGANYEYLWRYCYRAKPEYPPLKNSCFNSCGGSVTSISNPHIHPMGVMVTSDLYYLYKETGDIYHKNRADDSISWAMHILELYPEVMGYGTYGVLSERFCPSDGLIKEVYSDKSLGSTWFTFNGWAAANVLEGICEKVLIDKNMVKREEEK